MKRALWIGIACLALTPAALAQNVTYDCVTDPNSACFGNCGGNVNISGATLFQDFFLAPASTIDYVDYDCDGVFFDQLAPNFTTPNWNGWWLVTYRATGSGNGLAEFVRSHLEPGWDWWLNAADLARINRQAWNTAQWNPEIDPNYPYAPVHLAIGDVPTTWFVTVSGDPCWTANPTGIGYGNNPLKAWNANQSNKLKSLAHPTDPGTYGSLNLDLADPDEDTVYDTEIAWVPIAVIANRGVGLGGGTGNVDASDLQVLWLTGRLPNGENVVAATRDSGSGTRNGAMNSLCLDPSFGIGDNLNIKSSETASTTDALGPDYQATNMGGSSRMEAAVQNGRLAVGYTGLAGASRAVVDANAGNYELANVKWDIHGGTQYVRPSLDAVVLNCDPNTAWMMGGNETFASLGDPTDVGYPMEDGAAKDYLNNIRESILGFVSAPTDPNNAGSPAEYLAGTFTLVGAVSCLPNPLDPCTWQANANLNSTLQTWTRNNNTGISNVPGYGAISTKTPARKAAPTTPWPTPNPCDCAYPATGFYSDGRSNPATYLMIDGTTVVGSTLAARNWLSGDLNGDGARNIGDIPALAAAYYDRYVGSVGTFGFPFPTYAPLAGAPANSVSVDIIADFNGDGNFDCRDMRYFCDGLALSNGVLARAQAFEDLDDAWFALTGDDNFFDVVVYDCDGNVRPHVRGAAAFDIAGSQVWPGAAPHGHDCRVDCVDAAYIDANFGTFGDITDCDQFVDASADVTNDLVVDCDDLQAIFALLGCCCPDLVNDCCDDVCVGDLDCDGMVDFGDINPFVLRLSNPAAYLAAYPDCPDGNGDITGDGTVDFGDINPFVALMSSGQGPCAK